MMIRNAVIIFLFVSLFFFVGPAQGELLDRIVAVVNNDIITLSDLNELYLPYAERIRKLYYPSEKEQVLLFEARKEILNRLIEQKLADQEISAKNIRVSDEEVDSALERVKQENAVTEEQLAQALAKDGYTLEAYKERLKEQILQAKLVDWEIKSKVVITEDEIRQYYNEHKELYKGKVRYHIRSILLKISPFDNEHQVSAAVQRGEEIIRKIRNGLTFEDAAKEFSEAESAADGGDLGFFTLDELTPALREELQKLQEGDVSHALRTPAGIQIVKLVRKEEIPEKSLEEAKAEIHQKLFQSVMDQKYQEWLKRLKEKAYIKIML